MFREAIINNSPRKVGIKSLTKSVKALTTKISFLFVKLRTTRKANKLVAILQRSFLGKRETCGKSLCRNYRSITPAEAGR